MSLASDWIIQNRPDLQRPEPGPTLLGQLDEWEAATPEGTLVPVRTLFLRGSECRFRCTMCDLWRHTYGGVTPAGHIPQQILKGLDDLAALDTPPRWVKLYNASNFFDAKNVPTEDLPAIARLVSRLERVIVECHPRLLQTQVLESFAALIKPAQLEVAMGLETIHPDVLDKLNKQMTVADYQRAVECCHQLGVTVRTFALLQPPWMDRSTALSWCQATIDTAVAMGSRHICVIPVRGGNGALEHLASVGQFTPPTADMLEQIMNYNLAVQNCVVTVDLWDWDRLAGTCVDCSRPRRVRLASMNLHRQTEPPVVCERCNVG